MGACIMQRDESIDHPPKKQEPSDYHIKRESEIKKSLLRLTSMTDKMAQKMATKDYNDQIKNIKLNINKTNKLKEKYEKMLVKVRSWKPPTPDHENLKQFMEDQILQSISFDCVNDYYKIENVKQLTGDEWKRNKMETTLRDLNYHKKEYDEEIIKVTLRNKWIDKLYESLPKEKKEKK